MKIRNSGFTMIEMMLAMTFVAFLMLTIALTTISLGNTYMKGITMTQVNEAGRTIADDLQKTVTSAPSQVDFSYSDSAYCFGNYSYVWNKGGDIVMTSDGRWPSSLIKYERPGSELDGEPVRLAKVIDPDMSYCADENTGNITEIDAVELVPEGDRNLAIQQFSAERLASSATQTMYRVMFVLSTNNQEALMSNDMSCRPPADVSNEVNYCAVSSFDFLVRAGGGR